MNNYPSLRQLQYFIALCDTLSFSKAAERCFVTQSTLSAGIKELEQILNAKLVERSSRHVFLTPLGKVFENEAKDLLDHAETMMARLRGQEKELSGSVQIGIIPTIAPFYASEFFKQVTKTFAQVIPLLSEGLSDQCLERLRHGEIDLALIALPYNASGFETATLFSDPFYLAAPKGLSKKKTISLDALNNMDLLLLEDGHCLSDHAIGACRLQQRKSDQRHRLSSMGSLLSLAAQTGRMTLVTEMMRPLIEKQGQPFDMIPIKPDGPARDIALIWRKGSFGAKIAEKLV